jgi:phosphopantetheinyl transferase (holo-ACP synthase)
MHHGSDIEIVNNNLGKPEVRFSSFLAEKLKRTHVLVSISHCVTHAAAVAIWTKN